MREKAEEDAKQAFADAMRAFEGERKKLSGMEADLVKRKADRKAKVQAYMNEVMAKGVGVGGLAQMNRFEDRLKADEAQLQLDIDRQKEAVSQAEKEVETKRFEMAEAAKEKKAIEKHKDNWKKEVRKERMTKEENNQEEIGNNLHLQRVRAAEKSQKS
jgi:flagellar export protein FliJ